jgi:hypothetical protein
MTTNSSTPDLPDLDDILEDDSVTPLSLTEIYNEVVAHGEIILTIPADEEQNLRTGLAGVKAKQNLKLKEAGLQPDRATLSFVVTPHGELPEVIKVHIALTKKQTISVMKLELPDDTI